MTITWCFLCFLFTLNIGKVVIFVHLLYLTSDVHGIQVLAAHRYGIKRVILPERNLKDLSEVPSPILSGMEVNGCNVVLLCLLRAAVCCSLARDDML
jgi:hypothetical protein